MSNTYGIFEEWKNGLLGYADKAGDKLLGTKQSVLPGQDTMRRGDGLIDQGLNYAGGKIDQGIEATKDYVSGDDKLVSSPSIGQTERPGFKSGNTQAAKDLDKAVDYGIKKFDTGVNKSKNFIEKHSSNAWNAMFPDETNSGSISKADKEKFMAGYGEGKVDPKLVEAMKEKTSGLGQKDIGTLEKIMGVDFDTAKANWKDKGGFEGLMSNPAFSLGLALMQSSANGKTINQGILDNFVKSAKISSEFKDRIKAKGSITGPASAEDIGQVEAFLGSKKIGKSGFFDKVKDVFTGSTNQADYRRMLSDVAQYNNKRANQLEAKGKKVVKDESFMEQSILEMKSKGLLKTKTKGKTKGLFSNFNFNQTKIQGDTSNAGLGFRAQGGPVTAGKPYMVGEKGPEIIIPRSDGDVLTNDDSQIYAMLLASNPQLQKVSKTRAEKIMRNRFPEYFEG